MTRILVCGGRDFPSDNTYRWLCDNLHSEVKKIIPEFKEITLLIDGGAKGADLGANRLAIMEQLPHLCIPIRKSEWTKYGKVAGVIRNKKLLDIGKPDIGIAFPGGSGTGNMISLLQKANLPIIFPYQQVGKQDANVPTLPGL